jgi:hypothetical protein
LYIVDGRRKIHTSIKRRNIMKRKKDRIIVEGFFDVIDLALIVHHKKTSAEGTVR